MANIDFEWHHKEVGNKILQSVKSNGKLKRFGLLEKPTLAAPYSQYEEVNYKIMLIGKACCGKTTFLDSLCSNKSNSISLNNEVTVKKTYSETPGIHITHLYWPVKMLNYDRFLMFDLGMWDVGNNSSTKYEYILPACTENLDCFIFVFSWTDKQSFLEISENIKQIYKDSTTQQTLPKIIIGTKFDQIVHSEIEPEMIEELESLTQTRILRFSALSCGEEQVNLIMNRLCEILWHRDQRLAALKK